MEALDQYCSLRASAVGRFGTSPRTNAVRLPGITNVEFSLNKAVRMKERRSVEFRVEFFNLLNSFNPDPAGRST